MCISRICDYFCKCNVNFMGKDCEIVNYCYNKNCLDYGICYNDWIIYICVCYIGYFGKDCECDRCYVKMCL